MILQNEKCIVMRVFDYWNTEKLPVLEIYTEAPIKDANSELALETLESAIPLIERIKEYHEFIKVRLVNDKGNEIISIDKDNCKGKYYKFIMSDELKDVVARIKKLI